MSDQSENNLPENTNNITIKDINQNAETVNNEVDTFRRWLLSREHLKCPTDYNFLLKFLRVAKFDQEKAKKRLDKFCTVRASPKGLPQCFEYFQIGDPIIDHVFKLKIFIPLGTNNAGEFVLLLRPGGWNPDQIPFDDMIKVIYMSMECLIADATLQTYGMGIVYDLAGVSKKALRTWARPNVIRQMVKVLRESTPARNRTQIFHNEPLIFDIAFDILSLFLKKKLKDRTFRVKDDIRKAMDKIPGLERILPSEYGGEGGTIEQCTERWKENFFDYYKNGSPFSVIKVDESKRK